MSPAKRVHTFIAVAAKRIVPSLLAFMLLISCGKTYDEVRLERIKEVNKASSINIAVIWDNTVKEPLMVEGITLAADEINEKGGLFGRPLKLKVYYAKDNEDEQKLALKVAKNTSFAAVIGHRSSENAILASIKYEYYGLLFISPSSSSDSLTNHNFEYTFRTITSDHYVSKEIATFMRSQGHKRVAIIDDRSIYGDGIADDVEESLAEEELEMVVRRQYTPGKTDFKQLCAELLRYKFDAIFIGGMLPQAAEFIREARQMGLNQRVFAGSEMDSRALERIAGNSANGTVVATSFNVDMDNPLTKDFVKNFKKRYGKPPDTRAALGYDSLKLLFQGMRRGKSVEPLVVASNMRFIKEWQGVAGSYTFDLQGDLVAKECYFKYLNQTRFIFFDVPTKDDEDSD